MLKLTNSILYFKKLKNVIQMFFGSHRKIDNVFASNINSI